MTILRARGKCAAAVSTDNPEMSKILTCFVLAVILIALVSVGSSLAFAARPSGASAASGCIAPYKKYYTITMSGAQESPSNVSPGTGYGTVLVDTISQTMQLSLSFSGLVGTTTAAFIHSATAVAFTGTAGVATTTPAFAGFPLGVTSGTSFATLDMTQSSSYNSAYVTANGGTTAAAFCALSSGIDAGKAYFNIHTVTFPGGEIRGFIVSGPQLFLPLVSR